MSSAATFEDWKVQTVPLTNNPGPNTIAMSVSDTLHNPLIFLLATIGALSDNFPGKQTILKTLEQFSYSKGTTLWVLPIPISLSSTEFTQLKIYLSQLTKPDAPFTRNLDSSNTVDLIFPASEEFTTPSLSLVLTKHAESVGTPHISKIIVDTHAINEIEYTVKDQSFTISYKGEEIPTEIHALWSKLSHLDDTRKLFQSDNQKKNYLYLSDRDSKETASLLTTFKITFSEQRTYLLRPVVHIHGKWYIYEIQNRWSRECTKEELDHFNRLQISDLLNSPEETL